MMSAVLVSLYMIFNIAFSQWIIGSPRLPRTFTYGAAGIYNKSVFLLGGLRANYQVVEYKVETEEMIDYGTTALSAGLAGYAQNFCQNDEYLYVIRGGLSWSTITRYNMRTKVYEPSFTPNMPYSVYLHGTMTISNSHLFVCSGIYDNSQGTVFMLNDIQTFNLQTLTWEILFYPMQIRRHSATCEYIEQTNELFVIGGGSSTKSIEKLFIDFDNPKAHNWTFIDPLRTDGGTLASVVHSNLIWLIGGHGSSQRRTQTINYLTYEVTLLPDYVPYNALRYPACVIDSDQILCFGGTSGSPVDTFITYDLLSFFFVGCLVHTNFTLLHNMYSPPTPEPTQFPSANPTYDPTKIPTEDPISEQQVFEATSGRTNSVSANESDGNQSFNFFAILVVALAAFKLALCVCVFAYYHKVKKQQKVKESESNIVVKDENQPDVFVENKDEEQAVFTSDGMNENAKDEGHDAGHMVTPRMTSTVGVEEMDIRMQNRSDVNDWLNNVVKLPQYYQDFVKHGFESLSMVSTIEDCMKLEEMKIVNVEHQAQIMNAIQDLQDDNDLNAVDEYIVIGDNDEYETVKSLSNDDAVLKGITVE